MKTKLFKILLSFFFIAIAVISYAQRSEVQENEEKKQNPEQQYQEQPQKQVRHRINDLMSLITPFEEVKIFEANEIKPNKIVPRWYCPFLEVDTYYNEVELAIGNFSIKPVKVRLILWNYDGSMESTCDFEIKGKAHVVFLLDYAKDLWSFFRGTIEIQSDSPAVFPSAHYLAEETIPIPNSQGRFKLYTESFTLDWYRLD